MLFSFEGLFVSIIAVVIALSCHEMAHALVSYWFGDPTAKMEGRLSLNPFKHVDWVGLICLLFFGFGWAKPVPIDSRYYKDQKTGIIWTSFAGPFVNLLLGFLCVFFFYALQVWHVNCPLLVYSILNQTAMVNIGFAVFNLIPIPPLDGSKILLAFLPDELYYRWIRGNEWMYLLFLALLILDVFTVPMSIARSGIYTFFSHLTFAIL